MKTVGKRINPAFTVVQPLPAWPVLPPTKLDVTSGDRRTNAPSVALEIAVAAAISQKNSPSVATAN